MAEAGEWRFLVLNKKQSLEVGIRHRITIGREAGNDLVLQDDEVSRSHAIIYRVEDGQHTGKMAIKDLNSLNGIFHNGRKLRGAVLEGGDELILGSTILLLSPDSERDIEECLSSKGKAILKKIGTPKPFVPASVESLTVPSLVEMAVERLQEGTTTAFWSRFDPRQILLSLAQLAHVREPETFYPKLLQAARQATGADRGVIMMSEPGGQTLTIRALLTDQQDQTIFISQSIIRTVMKSRKAVYSVDVGADDRFTDLAQQGASQKPRSLMALPLEGPEGPIGFLYLDTFRASVTLDLDSLMLAAMLLQPVMQFEPLRSGR